MEPLYIVISKLQKDTERKVLKIYCIGQCPCHVKVGLKQEPASQRQSKTTIIGQVSIKKRRCYITGFCYPLQLHSKTVLAHVGAFQNKCTIKHPFHTRKVWKFIEKYITLFCLEKIKTLVNYWPAQVYLGLLLKGEHLKE